MINEIKYSGFATAPSDYECPDGQLAASLNLIAEDGHLKPLFQPRIRLLTTQNGSLVLIHHTANQTNYIIRRGNALYWMVEPPKGEQASDREATLIKEFDTINDLAIIGNVIAVAASSQEYILWKDNHYYTLGARPPFVSIEFGCTKRGRVSKDDILTVKLKHGPQVVENPVFDPEPCKETSDAVYGLMLPEIADKITNKGYFYMPFFVRYAYRLFDGSHIWHSAPILMLPSVTIPRIKVSSIVRDDDNRELLNIGSQLSIPYFSLDYRVGAIADLSEWKDIVAGVDIYITAPIYTYNQSAQIEGFSTRKALCSAYTHYNPDPTRSGHRVDGDNVSAYILGHYRNLDPTDIQDSNFKDITTTSSDDLAEMVWGLNPNEQFHDQIKSCNNGIFYKIASLDFESIVEMQEFKQVPVSSAEKDLGNLAARETLEDDYQSHFHTIANRLLAYNSRLCMTDLRLSPPVPFPFASCVEAATTDSATEIQVKVYTRLNGVMCYNIKDDAWDMTGHFPRYIFYPDASAYKMNIRYGGRDHFIILTPHDFLNGAYYYGGLEVDPTPESTEGSDDYRSVRSVEIGNKVYVSEVNNPFVFAPANIISVGTGRVMGLASAAKALSQGQFGQFPLYAFTTDGIWALEVSATGTILARQPITRDVCIDARSITPIDSSVLYATSRGIMQISGSTSVCLSEVIDSETPFDVMTLPHMDELHEMLYGHTSEDKCFPLKPFSEFLVNCRMAYDYPRQRIYVFNPDCNYSYIFSIKSRQWGIIFSHFVDAVPSYPDALVMASYPEIRNSRINAVLDFSDTGEIVSNGLLVTRPLKLGDPNLLKTVNTVIQRGDFAKGSVMSVIYGSRDLVHWHLVYSSRNHYLGGFRGTPYKYFRLALVTRFSSRESIYGASVDFEARLANRLR